MVNKSEMYDRPVITLIKTFNKNNTSSKFQADHT